MRACLWMTIALAFVGCGEEESPAEASTMGSGAASATSSAAGGGTSSSNGSSASNGSGGSGGSGGHGGAQLLDYCAECPRGMQTGTVASGAVGEASGIAASAVHAGVFYLHNDSGDSARFFAVDETGADLGVWDVSGAIANDWEDLARGPCDAQSCLFLGDIGNNSHAPSKPYAIYRVTEPDELGTDDVTVQADALPFAYPDGYPNSETLLVHPQTGVITLVTKVDDGPSAIFEFPMPLTPAEEVVLLPAGEVEPPNGDVHFTAGDVHPAGLGVLLRTYTDAFFYAMSPTESVAEALQRPPCAVPPPGGGEAIAWLADGSGYLGVPEGDDAPITVVQCGR
jgi:hypothetical protein